MKSEPLFFPFVEWMGEQDKKSGCGNGKELMKCSEESNRSLRYPLFDARYLKNPLEMCRYKRVVLKDLEPLVHRFRQRRVERVIGIGEGVEHLEEAQVAIGQLKNIQSVSKSEKGKKSLFS